MKTPYGSVTTPKAAAIAASWAYTTPLLFPGRPKGKYEQPRVASLPPMGIASTVLLRVVGAAGFGWWKYAGGFGKEGVLWVVRAVLAAPLVTANRQIRTAIGPKEHGHPITTQFFGVCCSTASSRVVSRKDGGSKRRFLAPGTGKLPLKTAHGFARVAKSTGFETRVRGGGFRRLRYIRGLLCQRRAVPVTHLCYTTLRINIYICICM
ncbi:hypothetical protein C4D60_Mb10t14560 [Musa balbisiana]|uniref:Uncharacterized protein n=1 Tax=Musa balbisiana TaxID=52838 RepID=A0A4S8IZJ6_MUSBA|nr:hypothetical protein C4D60_Mb10t14560 [Musa balbisiana]